MEETSKENDPVILETAHVNESVLMEIFLNMNVMVRQEECLDTGFRREALCR